MSVRLHLRKCAKTTALRIREKVPGHEITASDHQCTCAAEYGPGASTRGRCPCGGVILADTDDCPTPLCIDCAGAIVKSSAAPGAREEARDAAEEENEQLSAEVERLYMVISKAAMRCTRDDPVAALELLLDQAGMKARLDYDAITREDGEG